MKNMSSPNKQKLTLGVTKEIVEWGKEKARSEGMSLSVYVEQLLRSEKRKEENGQ